MSGHWPQPPYTTAPRPRAHTYADPRDGPAVHLQDPYRSIIAPANPGNPMLQPSRQFSAPPPADSSARGYLPPPPPPLVPLAHAASHLPPTPPRVNGQQQQHAGLVLPPPPPPMPSLHAPWSPWTQLSIPQPTNYPPPPPANTNREPRAYDPTAYSAYMTMPPLPPADQPLTSATYIPGRPSYGPTSKSQSQWYSASHEAHHPIQTNVARVDGQSSAGGIASSARTPDAAHQRKSLTIAPPQPSPSVLQHSSSVHHHGAPSTPSKQKSLMVMPAKQKQEYSSPAPQRNTSVAESHVQSAHTKDERSAEPPVSPLDLAWPIDRVIELLAANGFSKVWQDAFRHLNLHGSQFLDIGRQPKARAVLFGALYPQIDLEYAAKGITVDWIVARKEGRRATTLIAPLVEQTYPAKHQRNGSIGPPLPNTDSDGQDSPRSVRQDNTGGTTPFPADSAEGSPSSRPQPALFDESTPQRSKAQKQPSGHKQSNSDSKILPHHAVPKSSNPNPGNSSTPSEKEIVDGHKSRPSTETKSRPMLRPLRPKDGDMASPVNLADNLFTPVAPALPASRPPISATTPSDRKFVFATPDRLNYRLIDLSGADTADAIRGIICYNLGISDDGAVKFHFTTPGQIAHGEALSEAALLNVRIALADPIASLKLYVDSGLDNEATNTTQWSSGLPTSPAVQVGRILTPKEATQQQWSGIGGPPPNSKEKSIRGTSLVDFDKRESSPYDRYGSFPSNISDQKPLRTAPKPPAEPSSTVRTISTKRQRPTSTANISAQDVTGDAQRGPSDVNETNIKKPEGRSESIYKKRNQKALKEIAFGQTVARTSPGGQSPRSPMTMSKGGMPFNVPEYGVDGVETANFQNAVSARPTLTLKLPSETKTQPQKEKSPNVSPSTAHPHSPILRRSTLKDYGPSFELPVEEVSFARPSNGTSHAGGDSEDDDSDEDLFQIPLAKRPSNNRSATPARDDFARDSSLTPGRRAPPRSSDNGHWTGGKDQHSTSTGAKQGRPQSFISDMWANRPPPEALVEHLDEFFPNVDLDQPVVDEGSAANVSGATGGVSGSEPSCTPADSATWMNSARSNRTSLSDLNENGTLGSDESTLKSKDYRSMVSGIVRRSGGIHRTRSIRDVVKSTYSLSGKTSQVSTGSISSERTPSNGFHSGALPNRIVALKPESGLHGLQRRKSTKMWNARIEEIKPSPDSGRIRLETIPQDPSPISAVGRPRDEPKRQPTFKWMRGQLIGKGTFGRVYLGMNTTTGELLAVKQVEVNPRAPNVDPTKIREMVKALDQEIDTMQHLDHVNIVQYLGCEHKEYSISIFLEYISGGSIGSVLRKHGKFEESVVSSLTRQTLEGLKYLHHECILHRDLKADNILLDLDGTCKISDFGISKKSRNPYNNDTSNSMQGSVFWMAPEVIRAQSKARSDEDAGSQGYSAKVDIWSLGCVVLEMFAGHRPWNKEEAMAAMFKLGTLNQAPPIPDDVSSVVGPAALSFMYDCFTIDPADRPTAETLLRAPFCFSDPHYNFLDTELYAKIRGAFSL